MAAAGWIAESGDITEDALTPNAIYFSFNAGAYDRASDEAQAALSRLSFLGGDDHRDREVVR